MGREWDQQKFGGGEVWRGGEGWGWDDRYEQKYNELYYEKVTMNPISLFANVKLLT